MFHDERFHSIHLKKSNILNFIWFLQAMWFSSAVFIIPLYLYEIFQSGEIVWQIISLWGFAWVITTLLISVLLSKISRWILFKISITTITLWIVLFCTLWNFFEASSARAMLTIWWTVLIAIINLYLKDLSEPEKLADNQWYLWVSINMAWLIWPVLSWMIFKILWKNKEYILNKYTFLWNWEYLEYNWVMLFALFFIILTLMIFLWWKFINKHPHLQNKKHSKEINKHYHLTNFKFIWEYFKNKYRTISFLNIWMTRLILSWFLGTWFWILLETIWIPKGEIWLFFWLTALPLMIVEWFLWKIIKKLKWSINTLIIWYSILLLFLIIWITIWYENIYLFTIMFILSFIWMWLIQPLQQYQYFEWVNKENEKKFYSIHEIWWAITKLLWPFLIWIWISTIWIEKTFYFLPVLIVIFLSWLLIYKFKFENKKV